MDHKGVAITETIQALGEFRSISIGRGSSDLVSIDPFAPLKKLSFLKCCLVFAF